MPVEEANFTNREKVILRELSTDSRVSLTRLSKIAGCSTVTASKIIERLTQKLDIRFTLEVDMDKLGLSDRHIITIKFDKKPDEKFLYEFFKNDKYAQDVYLTQGDFDLLVFAAADTPINYIKWETDLGANLSDYSPEIRASEFVFPQLGFMPLNSGFVEFIRKEMKADSKDRQILKILNENSRLSYREISKRLDIKEDTIRYRIFKLIKEGIISRFTIAIQNTGNGYLFTYFMRYKFNKDTATYSFAKMREHYMTEDESVPVLSTYQFILPMSGSYRSFGMLFHKDKKIGFYKAVRWHKALLKKEIVQIKYATISKAIKSLLPLRNLVNKTSYKFIWK